jgi:hypothetical protein
MKKSPLPMVQNTSSKDEKRTRKETLVKLLRWHFGYQDFRGKQLEAIEAVLSGLKHKLLLLLSRKQNLMLPPFYFIFLKFGREGLFLFDANWWREVNVLSNSCSC